MCAVLIAIVSAVVYLLLLSGNLSPLSSRSYAAVACGYGLGTFVLKALKEVTDVVLLFNRGCKEFGKGRGTLEKSIFEMYQACCDDRAPFNHTMHLSWLMASQCDKSVRSAL